MSAALPVRAATLLECAPDAAAGRWLMRTANFIVELTQVDGSAVLSRAAQPDEYMAVVPPGVQLQAGAGPDTVQADGDALLIFPPGDSELRVTGRGLVLRVFSSGATDLYDGCSNSAAYRELPADLPPAAPWPLPVGGFRLRHYALAAHVDPTHISRVFRSTNLMLNVMTVYDAPRDPRVLKPHFHDDCEQITVTVTGRFAHHLRTPWGKDSTQWRADEHLEVDSPSVLVIPPRLIHTTQALEAGCQLIDVFGPPRLDFSLTPGLVCNADDYPMPPVPGR